MWAEVVWVTSGTCPCDERGCLSSLSSSSFCATQTCHIPHLFLVHHTSRPTPGMAVVVVWSLKWPCVPLSVTPWTEAPQVPLSSVVSGVCSHACPLIWWCYLSILPSATLCHPLPFLPSIFPRIWVFSNELALHMRWPKKWSFSISPSNEYSELTYFRIDWFDILAVQGILRSLLQHHGLKASILWRSASFMVQLLNLYMTTRKMNIS